MEAQEKRGPGGSSPDPSVVGRVLEAFVDLVAERGMAHLSVDDIAARAKVSKTTLYTRWPDRRSLIVAGFRHVAASVPVLDEDVTFPDAFDALVKVTAFEDVQERRRQVLAEMIAMAGVDDDVREVLHENRRRWRAAVEAMIEVGIRSGEVPPDRDVGVAAEVVMSVVTQRQLIGDRAIDESLRALVWHLLTEERPY